MRPQFDAADKEILNQREAAFNRMQGPRVGDFLRTPDGFLRFTHDWEDSIQTTVHAKHPCHGDASFYLSDGYASFSGSLDPAIDKTLLRDTGEIMEGSFWFFHHNWFQAENGVYFKIPCRVFEKTEVCDNPPEPKVIKGDSGGPNSKWEEVQAVQNEPFIFIMSNGSHWAGEELDDVAQLADVLKTETLDPRFDSFYSVDVCAGVQNPQPTCDDDRFIDGPRLYPTDGVYRFFGNFLTVSHVFTIDTNDKPTIELLTSLIDANMRSEAYQAQVNARLTAKKELKAIQQEKQKQQDAFYMV